MKQSPEDSLLDFIFDQLDPFTIPELLRFLGESVTAATCRSAEQYLEHNHLAYEFPDEPGFEKEWISRAGLFTDRSVLIVPGKDEIAAGVFIPGSRCVPFCNPSLLPHELTFYLGDQELPRKQIRVTPEDAYKQYDLFGEEYIPQYLSLDNEENAAIFSSTEYEDPDFFYINAVDMGDFYWKSGFKPGDRIAATLVDWVEGIFILDLVSASTIVPEREAKWKAALERNLASSFKIIGAAGSMDEQLAYAYFLGGDSMFSLHATEVSHALRNSSVIAFEPYGVETRLWFKDQTVPPPDRWTISMVSLPASLFEEALVQLGLPVSIRVFDSYILDSLYRRETDCSLLLDRLIPVRLADNAFCIPVIERAAASRLKELQKTYNIFADNETGRLRTRFIALHSELTRFIFMLRDTGLLPGTMPEQGAVILAQIMAHAISALENLDFPVSDNPGDIDNLWLSVEGMEESFFEIKTVINEALPELLKQRFTIVKKESPDERV